MTKPLNSLKTQEAKRPDTRGTQPVHYRDLPALLSTAQAANLLQVNPRTITRMCEQGKLKAVKVMSLWRINRDALFEFAGIGGEHVA